MPWPFTYYTDTNHAAARKISPLSLPEIRFYIRPLLDRPSLLACCQLNHAFHDDYIHHLRWHSVVLERISREFFPVSLIIQHESLIRQLILEDTHVFISGWKFEQCRNLRLLDLRVDSRRLDDDHGRNPAIREVGAQMLQLVRQNLDLEELRINWRPMSMQHRHILDRDLESLYSASLVTIRLSESTIEVRVINALIVHCPRLQELQLDGYYFSPWGSEQLVLELKHVKKLTLGRTAVRHGMVGFIGPEIRELSLRFFLHDELGGPVWMLPKVELLCLENLEGAVVRHLLRKIGRHSTVSKVELRKMAANPPVEALKAVAEHSGASIRELVVDWDSMWMSSWADRRAVLRQMPNLTQLNGYSVRTWWSITSSCVIS